jgi:hypothetical protein
VSVGVVDDVTVEALERDPYPTYARLRREAPVAFGPCVGLWFVTRWHDVVEATEDPDRFPAALPGSPLDRTLRGVNVLTVDGEDHRRRRAPTEATLRPHRVMETAPPVVSELAPADRRIRRGRPRGVDERVLRAARGAVARPCDRPARCPGRRDPTSLVPRASDGDLELRERSGQAGTCRRGECGGGCGTAAAPRTVARGAGCAMVFDMLHAEAGDLDVRIRAFMSTLKLAPCGGLQEPGHGLGSTIVGLLERLDQLEAVRVRTHATVRKEVGRGSDGSRRSGRRAAWAPRARRCPARRSRGARRWR